MSQPNQAGVRGSQQCSANAALKSKNCVFPRKTEGVRVQVRPLPPILPKLPIPETQRKQGTYGKHSERRFPPFPPVSARECSANAALFRASGLAEPLGKTRGCGNGPIPGACSGPCQFASPFRRTRRTRQTRGNRGNQANQGEPAEPGEPGETRRTSRFSPLRLRQGR